MLKAESKINVFLSLSVCMHVPLKLQTVVVLKYLPFQKKAFY